MFEEASDAIKSVLLAKVTQNGIETTLGVLSMQQIRRGDEILNEIGRVIGAEVWLATPLHTMQTHIYAFG